MKKIKLIYAMMTAMFVVSSCTDFVDPAIPYNEFETGVYLRTVLNTDPAIPAPNSLNFDFFDFANSRFRVTLEAVDAKDGRLVQSVEIFVRHRSGITFSQEVSIATLSAADFQPNSETKYLRTTYEIGANEVLAALPDRTFADIDGGDSFDFRLFLTTTDGRTFTNNQSSGDIAGGAFFRSPFFYRVSVICPSNLGGTFDYESTNMVSVFGACPGTITGTVDLIPIAGTTGYTVSDGTFGFWECYGDSWGSGNLRLNDACGALSFAGNDKYGDSYSFAFVSNNGTEFTFTWTNSSNESGTVTLFAPAGFTWPAALR